MAQKNNSQVIALSSFALIAVGSLVALYFSYTSSNELAAKLKDEQTRFEAAKSDNASKDTEIRLLHEKITGLTGTETGAGSEAGTVVADMDKFMTEAGGDGTSAQSNLLGTAQQLDQESNNNMALADNRQDLYNQKQREYDELVTSTQTEIESFKTKTDAAELKLRQQEQKHSEELETLQTQINSLRREKATLDATLSDVRDAAERREEELLADISNKSLAVEDLRRRLRAQDDPQFARPDGVVTTVDHSRQLVFINRGSADGIRTGISFSVYQKDNSGVGRNNTSDIKGSIEIIEVLGPRQASARIIQQEEARPIASDDPIYSPLFQAGQALEVVIAGRVAQDGLTRSQFRRLVSQHGARIVCEVTETGEFADGQGNTITQDEAVQRITSGTRYLVIGDLGDLDSKNSELVKRFRQIRERTEVLRDRALNLGIYEVGLSTFLEHVGFARTQLSYTPTGQGRYPGTLPNGARSERIGQKTGRRESSANVSGLYTGRRPSSNAESSGSVSGAYTP